jgi:hypothetical protein
VPWSAFQPKYQVIAKNIIGGTMAKRRRLISRSKFRALNQRSQLPVVFESLPMAEILQEHCRAQILDSKRE